MFDIGIMYAIVAAAGIFVCGIILNRARTTEYPELIDRHLCRLLIFFMLFCTVDAVWGVLTSEVTHNGWLSYAIMTYAFHFAAALSAFIWAGYVIYYIDPEYMTKSGLNIARAILLMIQMVSLLSNIGTSDFFKITKDGVYHAYRLRRLLFVFQFAYYVILIICGIVLYLKAKNTEEDAKKRYKYAIVFSMVPLLFGLLQMLWPNAPMYSLGFMITAVLIYSFNVTSEREVYVTELLKRENNKLQNIAMALSEDFKVIFYVDLKTHEYERFSKIDDVASGTITKGTGDFFEDRIFSLKGHVPEDEYSSITKMFTKENILAELAGKPSFSFDYKLETNGQMHYYMCKIIRADALGEDNKIIVASFNDDERIMKEMEQRRKLEEAVQRAEDANIAKTNFLFSMSHDIRTPMNAILGFSSLAKKHLDEREYIEKCLDNVNSSGEHLLALINDVLDMSKIESGKLSVHEKAERIVDIYGQVNPIVLELAAAKSIKFDFNLKNVSTEFIFCDRLHLCQILINILTNSVKYTPNGGSVSFIVEEIPSEKEDCAKFRFEIADTGIGMSEEFLNHIFDTFAREESASTSKVEGTGLGMSIVKRLVELMNGTIDIKSEVGNGTTTTCLLEFRKAEEKQVEKETSESEINTQIALLESKRILLVDDNNLNRIIAMDMLEEMGIVVTEAVDGVNAIEILSSKGENSFDCVLMDVQMPGMDGYETTKKIRSELNMQRIPIVAMTANAFEEDRQNALNAGMNDHMTKPVNIKKLAAMLLQYT